MTNRHENRSSLKDLREIGPEDNIKSHKILFATALLALALFLFLRMGGGF
jgi:hypothetical protein